MNYTVKIEDKDPRAKSIINMLKELARDYTFLNIYEENPELSENIVNELESRYHYVLKNPKEGKSWEEVIKGLESN